ncbi:MAG: HAMP domain-containing protein [Deltaproteobacteria bacterium]|nr:HAMP domain-containing protein [Deltaproteobacteria bacterium]
MKSDKSVPIDKETRKRRRERVAILVVLIALVVVTYIEVHSDEYGMGLPLWNSVLFFALVNINTTLLLLLIFLVVRNLVKLLFERKQGILGAKLRTRLVVAFTGLSLIPTILLFFLSLQFISSSIERWFSLNVEHSLQNALDLGTSYYQDMTDEVLHLGKIAAQRIEKEEASSGGPTVETVLSEEMDRANLAFLSFYSLPRKTWITAGNQYDWFSPTAPFFAEPFRKALVNGESEISVLSRKDGDWLVAFVPLSSKDETGADRTVVIAARNISSDLIEKMEHVSAGYESYKQALLLKNPIKTTHYIILSMVTLIILFFATWYGFYLSRELTDPIQKLAEATNRVALGDYDVEIDIESRDEIGTLVRSFNQMAQDLMKNKRQLDSTNQQLVRRNLEIEQRRQYMEVLLKNVAAGVIAVDAQGRITTVNKSAERMLSIRADKLLNRHIDYFIRPPYGDVIQGFLDELELLKVDSLEKQVKIPIGSSTLSLLVKINQLKDEDDQYMGMVVVLDDLSEMEKAQRIIAWREVARRIAHEIKNPLTPIQLCAQRLQKRYGDRFQDDGQVFKDCTSTIVQQVKELKRLVNEFSTFARMPAANPMPNDLNEIIEETLPLYKESHKRIAFSYERNKAVPLCNVDKEQMKRVLVNLLDNAVSVVEADEGEVLISADYDPVLKLARIEIADNGPGIPAEDRPRLFEPYFSTKKSGTGLGLAIVNTIIQDHDGYIRVRDNKPKGTRFVIELPVRR